MRRIQLYLLGLFLAAGLTGMSLLGVGRLPLVTEIPRGEQYAWWGSLYPEYCLPGAMRLVEEGDASPEEAAEIPIKIRFKYLTFFNRTGE